MTAAARLVVSCWALLAIACGAGDNRLDPSDLELRDLLGVSPDVASAWDADQRAAARRVIDAGLRRTEAVPEHAALAGEPALDRSIARSLASLDSGRARRPTGALGLVRVDIDRGELLARTRAGTIAPRGGSAVEIRLAGWDGPALRALPARGLDVLASIAADAGHTAGPIVVVPAPRLAVVAGYVAGEQARLVVNPVLLAALEPSTQAAPAVAARTIAAATNPYSFYGSVEQCASAQRARCDACVYDRSCVAITNRGDGTAECLELGANQGRGYALICVNLALAIDSVASCTGSRAPTCALDTRASESMSTLDNNAHFIEVASCGGALDACLDSIFGSTPSPEPPPPTSSSCDDAGCDPGCGAGCGDAGATACEDDQGSCSDSGDSSSCEDTSGGGSTSGGDCGNDSEDACGSSDNSGCSDSGGECSGGGEDCSGGGGDCSGGDSGECSVAGKRGRGAGGTLVIAVLWAFLPVPFAISARRRAERRRARAEQEASS